VLKRYNSWTYKPIFYWKEWHVWEFIKLHKLPYPSLYDEGFDRIGCVICPFIFHNYPAARKKVALHRDRWPGMYKAFEAACKKWFQRRFINADGQLTNRKHDSFEEYIEAYYRGFEE
jgi:phosphoadenosine phosphosulfate reductase